jgi:hypothetical protein
LQDRDLASLTDQERALRSVGDLRAEVNSGGFSAYFWTTCGDLAEIARRATAEVAPDLAELLQVAMAVIATPYPTDVDERQRLIDRSDTVEDELDQLDDDYYRLEATVDLVAAMARLCP